MGSKTLLCTPPGPRPGTGLGSGRARPGGGLTIFVLPHDLPISGLEKNFFKLNSGYKEEQSQGYNRRTMSSFTNFSSNKNV